MLSNWFGTGFSLDFSSHRQSSTGSVVVTAARHDATVSKHTENKTKKAEGGCGR